MTKRLSMTNAQFLLALKFLTTAIFLFLDVWATIDVLKKGGNDALFYVLAIWICSLVVYLGIWSKKFWS
jgi:hypothetical protein